MRYLHWFGRLALVVALTAAVGALAFAEDKKNKDKQEEKKDKDKDEKKDKDKDKDQDKEKTEPDVVFVPTPQEVVDKMLEVAKVTKDDVVYDLGCGDGRIVCTAARKYKCKAFGFDVDPDRIKDSEASKSKEEKDVQKLITFEKKDIFKLDLSGATVITLYLLPDLNVKLIPQLKKLKKGARIVSHAFDMKGVTPEKGYPIQVKKDGLEHDVYLWTVPLKIEEKKDKD